jgi:hypothetical protein
MIAPDQEWNAKVVSRVILLHVGNEAVYNHPIPIVVESMLCRVGKQREMSGGQKTCFVVTMRLTRGMDRRIFVLEGAGRALPSRQPIQPPLAT